MSQECVLNFEPLNVTVDAKLKVIAHIPAGVGAKARPHTEDVNTVF